MPITAELNYAGKVQGKPEFYLYQPPRHAVTNQAETDRRTVEIHDGWSERDALSLDVQGIVIEHLDTQTSDMFDPDTVKSVYYPEVEDLVRRATGAQRVLAFDHNVRDRSRAEAGERGVQRPVKSVHNDYTHDSGPQRVQDLVPQEAATLLASRFAVINVWKPITGPVQRSPLAVCDASSMNAVDFVATDLKYRDRTGEIYSITYNPQHRWYYFPQMQAHDALLLKCYDSDTSGVARFTAHTAFDFPDTPTTAPARQSVEVRTLAFL